MPNYNVTFVYFHGLKGPPDRALEGRRGAVFMDKGGATEWKAGAGVTRDGIHTVACLRNRSWWASSWVCTGVATEEGP